MDYNPVLIIDVGHLSREQADIQDDEYDQEERFVGEGEETAKNFVDYWWILLIILIVLIFILFYSFRKKK